MMRLLKWTKIVFVLLAGAGLSGSAFAGQTLLHQNRLPQPHLSTASCQEMARVMYLPVVNQHPESALKKLWITSAQAVDLYFTAGCPWQVLMQANPGGVEYRVEKTMELDSYLLLRFQAVQQMRIALGFLHSTGDPADRSADEWAHYLPKFVNALSILRDQAPDTGPQPVNATQPPGRPDCNQVIPAFIAGSGLWMTRKDMVSVQNRVRMRAWLASGCDMKDLFAADDSLPGCHHVVAQTEQEIVDFVTMHNRIMLAEDAVSRPVLLELARLMAARNIQRMQALMKLQCVVSI